MSSRRRKRELAREVVRGYRPLHKRGRFQGHTLSFDRFDSLEAAIEFVEGLPRVARVETVKTGVWQWHRMGQDEAGATWACIVPVQDGKFLVEWWEPSAKGLTARMHGRMAHERR